LEFSIIIDAARNLGLESDWDNDDDADEEVFANAEPNVRKSMGIASTRKPIVPFNQGDAWNKLHVVIQENLVVLGFNELIWDMDELPSTDGKLWVELTPGQRNSALNLGYDAELWDAK